jgi:hypothetical protein
VQFVVVAVVATLGLLVLIDTAGGDPTSPVAVGLSVVTAATGTYRVLAR